MSCHALVVCTVFIYTCSNVALRCGSDRERNSGRAHTANVCRTLNKYCSLHLIAAIMRNVDTAPDLYQQGRLQTGFKSYLYYKHGPTQTGAVYVYILSHDRVWLQTGFGLVTGCIEHLQIVTTSMYIHTLYNSLQHALRPLSLLCLHRLSPGNGFQRRSFLSSVFTSLLTGDRLTSK
jgi:hypothetical protein